MVINSFASLRKGDLPTDRWTYGYISPSRYFQFNVFTVQLYSLVAS